MIFGNTTREANRVNVPTRAAKVQLYSPPQGEHSSSAKSSYPTSKSTAARVLAAVNFLDPLTGLFLSWRCTELP